MSCGLPQIPRTPNSSVHHSIWPTTCSEWVEAGIGGARLLNEDTYSLPRKVMVEMYTGLSISAKMTASPRTIDRIILTSLGVCAMAMISKSGSRCLAMASLTGSGALCAKRIDLSRSTGPVKPSLCKESKTMRKSWKHHRWAIGFVHRLNWRRSSCVTSRTQARARRPQWAW